MPGSNGDIAEEAAERVAGPRTVLRIMDILSTLAARPEGRTLTELSGDLGLPKTSAFSLLRALERGGYLRQEDGRYALGSEALKLGASLAQAIPFPRSARPVLEQLAAETGETIMLGVLSEEGHEVSYIDVIESDAALRFTVRTGNRRPLYSVASGKALLAFLPHAAQDAYLARTPFVRFTPDTSTKADLAQLLLKVRERGVVLDANGIVDGAAAVASPCFDAAGRVTCSVSLAGPTARMLAQQDRFERLTMGAAEQISRILGYRGTYPAAWTG